jgi:hypothetical protein
MQVYIAVMNSTRLLADGTVAQGFVLLDANGNNVPMLPIGPTIPLRRLIAYNNTASITVPTTPTPAAWTATTTNNSQWNVSDGTIKFSENCMFNSCFYANINSVGGASTVLTYYVDAEVSVDDGVTWVRGANSLRQETVRGSDNNAVRTFPFTGGFLAGQMIRFVHWASNSNCRLTTDTNNGSTAPALRLAYNSSPATFLA